MITQAGFKSGELRIWCWKKSGGTGRSSWTWKYLLYLPCPVACPSGKWNRREVANQDLARPALSGGEEALERGEVTLGDWFCGPPADKLTRADNSEWKLPYHLECDYGTKNLMWYIIKLKTWLRYVQMTPVVSRMLRKIDIIIASIQWSSRNIQAIRGKTWV